jgi:hypothetical protein
MSAPKVCPHPDLFWAKVDTTGDCWEWTASRHPSGYGQIAWRTDGKSLPRRAHRVAWELLVGSIPDGMELDHLCRNPACVNPDHLEVVTHRENMRRGMGVFGINARKTHCNSGHRLDEDNTIREPGGTRRCRTCKNLRRQEHYWRNPEKFRERERQRRARA